MRRQGSGRGPGAAHPPSRTPTAFSAHLLQALQAVSQQDQRVAVVVGRHGNLHIGAGSGGCDLPRRVEGGCQMGKLAGRVGCADGQCHHTSSVVQAQKVTGRAEGVRGDRPDSRRRIAAGAAGAGAFPGPTVAAAGRVFRLLHVTPTCGWRGRRRSRTWGTCTVGSTLCRSRMASRLGRQGDGMPVV